MPVLRLFADVADGFLERWRHRRVLKPKGTSLPRACGVGKEVGRAGNSQCCPVYPTVELKNACPPLTRTLVLRTVWRPPSAMSRTLRMASGCWV